MQTGGTAPMKSNKVEQKTRNAFEDMLFANMRLSRTELSVAARLFKLSRKTGFAYPLISELERLSGAKRSTVFHCLNRLVKDFGYFNIESGAAKHKRNHYYPRYEIVAANDTEPLNGEAFNSRNERGGKIIDQEGREITERDEKVHENPADRLYRKTSERGNSK